MRNLKVLCVIVIMSFFTVSCSSMVKGIIKKTGISNQIYIHPEAKAGDFLVTKTYQSVGSQESNYFVKEVNKDNYTVDLVSPYSNFQAELKKEPNGGFAKITKAYWVNDDGTKEDIKIAIRGEQMYTDYKKINQEKVPFKVETKNGEKTFECDVYDSFQEMEIMGQKLYFHQIQYISPDVKFGVVHMFTINTEPIKDIHTGPFKNMDEMQMVIDAIKKTGNEKKYIKPAIHYFEDGNKI